MTDTPVVRIPIRVKLIALIACLLVGSIVTLVGLSTQLFIESDTALIQQSNADTAEHLALQVRTFLEHLNEKMRWKSEAALDPEGELLGVFLRQKPLPHTVQAWLSPLLKNSSLTEERWEKLLSSPEMNLEEAFLKGQVQWVPFPAAEAPRNPLYFLAEPYEQDPYHPGQFTQVLVGVVDFSKALAPFLEANASQRFLVDGEGRLLAHSDPSLASAEVSSLEIVQQLRSAQFHNGQTRYWDPLSQAYQLGAFRRVGLAGMGVVSQVEEGRAFEAAYKVRNRAIWVGWITLCLAFWVGYAYSRSLTKPIQALSLAAKQVSQGHFHLQLPSQGTDEMADLSQAFNEMALGLLERDRVKEIFHKFHNKEVVDQILSGQVQLGGHRQVATIFFSDLRDFTALSETLAPEAVVEFLNEYFTRMVSIIRAHGGVVDKYVGDAIMALWGVPFAKPEDDVQAVKACLAMRMELIRLNETRVARGQPPLRMGMGLNRGDLIAGNIGSIEKMEYTVIGDAVNLASRIESLTKQYQTDLLVSESVAQGVQDRFVLQPCEKTKVKGKEEVIQVYEVLGVKETGLEAPAEEVVG